MPKYLISGSYTGEGVKGLLKEGGSSRQEAVEELTKSMGGSVEACYFAFGDDDVFVIVDMPDSVSVAATSLVVKASGAVALKVTVLITPEEMDQATKMTVDYRPPGQ